MAKKILVILLGLILVMIAAERVVVLEIGTGTWCPYCPAAANGAENLAYKYPGEVLVVEYHYGDAFSNADGGTRISFYGISGYPTAIFDGIVRHVGSNTVGLYEPTFLTRKSIEPPLEITLEKTYNAAYFGEWTVTATIVNVSDGTVSGKAHFTITESHIPYIWQGQDILHWVERDMLPNAAGQQITLEPGDTAVLERSFVINPSWPSSTGTPVNCELGCFVQGDSREILQAAVIPLMGSLTAEVTQTKIETEDGKLHPWVTADFLVTLQNTCEEAWSSVSGILRTDDRNVTVTDSLGSWGAAEPDEEVCNDDDPFTLEAGMNCPDGHCPEMTLALDDGMGREIEVEFRMFEPVALAEGAVVAFSFSLPTLVKDKALAALSVPAACDVKLVLLDASGRLVKTLFAGKASAGVNLVALAFEGIPDGAYFIKATCGNYTRVEKLVILH
ncbi:hypothetical protein ES703_28978 [subsurface metagenome]|nr:T9SS type A sorting domain-containing protein [bacterium]